MVLELFTTATLVFERKEKSQQTICLETDHGKNNFDCSLQADEVSL